MRDRFTLTFGNEDQVDRLVYDGVKVDKSDALARDKYGSADWTRAGRIATLL